MELALCALRGGCLLQPRRSSARASGSSQRALAARPPSGNAGGSCALPLIENIRKCRRILCTGAGGLHFAFEKLNF